METSAAKILYVEDDKTLSFITKDNLERKGYNVICCDNGKTALETFKKEKFNICIIDVMLPQMDGFTLAINIRKTDKNIPLIFLTAKSMIEDKIEGLKIGGDDYITKPFSIDELILKIEIFLKRSVVYTYNNEDEKFFKFGKYEFSFENLYLLFNNEKQVLTLKEAELLRFFCKNQNIILNRSVILKSVWGDDDYFMGRSLDVFISRLRKYINNDSNIKIETLHGIGFKFVVKN